jgi:hypothetical protein
MTKQKKVSLLFVFCFKYGSMVLFSLSLSIFSGDDGFPMVHPVLMRHREKRNEDDANDDRKEIFVHIDGIPEEIPRKDETKYPDESPDNAEGIKTPSIHLRDTRHDRSECPHDRYEPREEDRLSTVFIVEIPSTLRMLFLEEKRVLASE